MAESGSVDGGQLGLPVIGHDLGPYHFRPSIRAGMFQLPPDIDDFIGQDDALRELRSLLDPSSVDRAAGRVVVSTVAGRPGVGKTALATRVAHQLRRSFPDGQLYVNLRGAEAQRLKPVDVLAEFLLELGVARGAIPDPLEERAGRYRAQFADRQILVVLDNASDEAQVRPLLPGPGGAALITSRAPLRGLEGAHSVVLDVLPRDQAVELLAKVVSREPVAAEPEAARAIVELCGYLPLAVRIAGAKLATSGRAPLAALAGQLASEHGRLVQLRTGDLEVRASFALNYEGLNTDERRIFRLLGLLRAPQFPGWVAAALLDVEPVGATELIERLVKAEVLEVARKTPAGEARYRFHDLLRVFARENLWKLEPPASRATALGRVLDAYLALARLAADLLEPGRHAAPVGGWPAARLADVTERVAADPGGWFRDERVNLIAAVEQASDNDLLEVTWELAGTLTYFFRLQTHWTDWQHTQSLALRAARRAQNRQATANALSSLGEVFSEMGRFNRATAHFEQALGLFRDLGDRGGEAWTLFDLGFACQEQGRFHVALAHLEQGLALFRGLGDRRGEAWTLECLGLVHRKQGRLQQSLTSLERGLALFREVGDRRGEAYCLVNLGLVRRDRGQFALALEWYDQARSIFDELGDSHGETYLLLNQGHMLREQDRFEEAQACLEHCLGAFRRIGELAGEAWTRLNLGMVFVGQGRLDEAIAEFDRCRALFAALGDPRGTAFTLMGVGEVELARGGRDAPAHFERAAGTMRESNDRLGLAKALSGLARALDARGDREAATDTGHEALAIFRSLGASESSKVEAWLLSRW
jgi:tetratricopeptide (TPR) repeat protein